MSIAAKYARDSSNDGMTAKRFCGVSESSADKEFAETDNVFTNANIGSMNNGKNSQVGHSLPWNVEDIVSQEALEYCNDRDMLLNRLIQDSKDHAKVKNRSIYSSDQRFTWPHSKHSMCYVEYLFDNGDNSNPQPIEIDETVTETFTEFMLMGNYNVTAVTFHWFFKTEISKAFLDRIVHGVFLYSEQLRRYGKVNIDLSVLETLESNNDDILYPQRSNVPHETIHRISIGKKRQRESSSMVTVDSIMQDEKILLAVISTVMGENEIIRYHLEDFIEILKKRTSGLSSSVVKETSDHRQGYYGQSQIDIEMWLSCETALSMRPENVLPQQSYRQW